MLKILMAWISIVGNIVYQYYHVEGDANQEKVVDDYVWGTLIGWYLLGNTNKCNSNQRDDNFAIILIIRL